MLRRSSCVMACNCACMRSRRDFRLIWNLPRRVVLQIKVKPRKVKVSGLPNPRRLRFTAVIVQARKILTQFIYGLVDQGEQDEQRLTVGGLAHLKAIERDHAIKSAFEASEKDGASSSP